MNDQQQDEYRRLKDQEIYDLRYALKKIQDQMVAGILWFVGIIITAFTLAVLYSVFHIAH